MVGGKRKRTSEMWNFFKSVDENFARCNMCDTKLSYKTSTGNLKKHLIKKHSMLLNSDVSLKLFIKFVILMNCRFTVFAIDLLIFFFAGWRFIKY